LVVMAAVNLTIHRSTLVMAVTMSAVLVLATLAMIFVIQYVASPPAAKLNTALPSSTPVLNLHRRRVYRWAKLFAVVLAACALGSLLIAGNARFVVLALAGITLLLAAIALPVMYVTARNFDRALTVLMLNPWVRWQYPPEHGGTAYFGRDGMFSDGIFTTWVGLNIYLTEASIDERQPRSLVFQFEKIMPNPVAGNPVMPLIQRVAIPAGAEADIATLQHELGSRCPRARIRLVNAQVQSGKKSI
jgi:hypothetical protein